MELQIHATHCALCVTEQFTPPLFRTALMICFCCELFLQSGIGPCALRACSCSNVALVPAQVDSEFNAYFRQDTNCPPPPPPPVFAKVFGESVNQ